MKIAIVSDTHDNWANFKKAIDWIKNQGILVILHCGDISRQETINQANKFFNGPASAKRYGEAREIKYAKGNADWNLDLPEKLEIEFDNKKIGAVHYPNEAKKMAQSGKFDLVFYGHTHRPWDDKVGECHMINPGELAGQFYKPTFAVYNTETGELELKILEQLELD
ncbi:MAG: YfcE family phosphodiesterase [Candidatus Staskawiczbacteria bacterium]|nr:YfcE family phosphodiesterase [Candidatus Staskawiczbacteria bacterium]